MREYFNKMIKKYKTPKKMRSYIQQFIPIQKPWYHKDTGL